MPEHIEFDYSVIRVVPRVEREEFINVGIVLFCRELRYLAARIGVDEGRLKALAPETDLVDLKAQLELIPRICEGAKETGYIAELTQAERFRWLTSPRSTSLQFSPPHSGVCRDPRRALDDLFARLVRPI